MASAWIFGVLVLATACSPALVRVASAPATPLPAVSAPRFPEGRSERVRSRSLDMPIELMLPDKANWSISDGPSWLEAEHRASESKFALRTWRADRLVRRSECESQARLVRPSIPIAREESTIDARAFAAPAGFDVALLVGVEPSAQGVAGYAIVFGASVGYCYAAVFTTFAEGAGADGEIATRLGIAVDRVLSSVRTRSVDDRAVRHRLVATPNASK
ncbi:MAG TPA: hypothetical protein VK745_17890 [Polyangiaceae bacterium]|nr:hypothetical protein [Polyangiaceae bacterium]